MEKHDTLHSREFVMDGPMAVAQASPAPNGLVRAIRSHPLLSYFVMAYSFSWLGWLPYMLSQDGLKLLPFHSSSLLVIPGAYLGPCLSGFMMTGIMEGSSGVRRLLRRLVQWRVKWYWYLFVLLAIPLIRVSGVFGLPDILHTFRPEAVPAAVLTYLTYLPLTVVVSGGAEEPGWRGFALPRLQQRYGPLFGTLLLGVLWAGWHLPLFMTSWAPGTTVVTMLAFLGSAVSLAVVITWLFNHTQGSLLTAILLHGAVDAFSASLVFTHPLAASPVIVLIGFGTFALILIAVTRGRLGYQPRVAQRS